MNDKEILQFEADDTSKISMTGKQVFFAKRINGKTTHNKAEKEEEITFEKMENKEEKDENELFIKLQTPYFNEEEEENNNQATQKPKKKRKSKKKKSRKKRRKIIKVAILSLIITATIIFALISPIFNINKIIVTGNEQIDTQTVISMSGIQEGKNIFKVSKKQVAKNLAENPYIQNVTTKKILPGTIEITVEERKTAYQVKVINSYVYIDYQGYILEVSSKKAKVPEIEGLETNQDTLLNQKKISTEDIEILKKLIKIKEASENSDIWSKISKISIKDKEYTIEIKKENKIVYIGDATELTTKMMFLKTILENEKGNSGKIFLNGKLSEGFNPYFREN